MTEDQTKQLDLWGDWEPVVLEETESPDFSKPIRGKYKATIDAIEYKDIDKKDDDGTWEIISMKLKVVEDIEGDASFSRFLDKSFFMGVSQFSDDPIAGYKNLLNCLNSAGLYDEWMKSDNIRGTVELMNDKLKDKEVFVTAFPKGNKQQVRIVKPKDAKAGDSKPKSKFDV